MMTVTYIVAALLAILGIIILIGKGDMLIAGYNTASAEEKAKYNIKRIRLLVGGLLIGISLVYLLFHVKANPVLSWIFTVVLLLLVFIIIYLANTWAKKK